MGINLYDLGFGSRFVIPVAQTEKQKVDKLDFIKMKTLCI